MTTYFTHLLSPTRSNSPAVRDPSSRITPDQRDITYSSLISRVSTIRKYLLQKSSPSELNGARIGLMAHPSSDFIASVYAIWSVNAMMIPLCLSHPTQELAYTLSDADATAIIYHPTFEGKLQPLLKNKLGIDISEIPATIGTETLSLKELAELGVTDDSPALMGYTSGSTGKPKGVVHTHRSLGFHSTSLIDAWELSSSDRLLHVLPLHHTHGLFLSLIMPLFAGGCVEFMEKFDEQYAWNRILEQWDQITVLMAVPTIWIRMIEFFDRNFAGDPRKSKRASDAAARLRLTISGSAALPTPVRDRWAQISNGQLLLERYGMTETGILYTGSMDYSKRILGSVGFPVPGVETRLIDEGGRDVSNIPDTVGEIQCRTPGLFLGYWRKPEETVKNYTKDGWWRTGDMAVVKKEAGMACFIQGRASVDIIKSGGYKISALEIETELLSAGLVKECVVVGVEDEKWGEVVAAIIVPMDEDMTLESLRNVLRKRLAPYKLPTRLCILKEIPRNPMGKVNKKELTAVYFGNKDGLQAKL